ncbi:hypothetical protein B9479_001419 [Cryptococcus floricola]|uniref:VWFA domain-containing protein n=1 Tax=Cryptococcus floricola TaxID=2591691 RepID=A0A5D3B593_9TREE|nr:hypothetical protein B9479_001419 [Cryptococcus floricola]
MSYQRPVGRQQPRRYRLDPMMTNFSVIMALSNRQYTNDPEYVKEVVRNYINVKQSHGRQSWEISQKLELIERDFSQHGMSFVQARREMGLPPSRVIRVLGTNNSTSNNSLYRAQTTSGASTVSHRPSTASTSSRPAAPNHNRRTSAPVVQRPQERDPEAGEDAPPPPYASQDPDPEATRLLQERLAAESVNNPAVTAAVATPHTPQNSTPAASSPAPSTPMSPPTQPIASTQNAESPQAQSSQLPRPPSDPEMARIWEESQFEEAKRMSLQAQSEQEQLDEAMRLSLAEAESRAYNDSSEAGPSHLPVVTEYEPYQPPVQQNGGYETGLNSDLEGLNIGGSEGSYAPPAGAPAGNNRFSSIMDHDDNPSGFSQQPLTPSKTGPAMQSKNPFLAPSEQETHEAGSPQSSSYGYTQQQPEEPAGSSHTTYTPPAYAPPPGAPPPHLVIPSSTPSRQVSNENIYQSPIQNSPSSRPLPPTPDVAPPSYPSPRTAAAAPPSEHPSLTSSLYGARATDFDAAGSSLSGGVPRPGGISTGAGQTPDRRRTSYVPPRSGEDPLEMLREFDTVFLVDDSSSMAGPLWREARAAIMEVAEIASRYDEDGIDIHFLNSKRVGRELKGRDDVEELFEGLKPRGVTPTGMRLEAILRDYMTRLERASTLSPSIGSSSEEHVKPLNVVVVTDGAPTDDPESVIVAVARRLDRGEYPLSQVGIQFLQIGDDVGATMALQQLDDELSETHQIRDIVDTVPDSGQEMTAQFIIKTLLGGINRRLDRRG